MTSYYPQTREEEQWLEIHEQEREAMDKRRKLRPAVELVSSIGELAFDLQHHSDEEIAEAVAVLRVVNPQMFDWLVEKLAVAATGEPGGGLRGDPHVGIRESQVRATKDSDPTPSGASGPDLAPHYTREEFERDRFGQTGDDLRQAKADRAPAPTEGRKQIKFLTCRSCGCHIDAGLCGYDCEFDSTHAPERDPSTMEVRVYEFIGTEPAAAPPAPPKENL